jgi:L-amino acid N-acyltransferase YncA
MVTSLEPADWPSVRAIYLNGIASGNATLETSAPDWEDWNASHLPTCRFVYRDGDAVCGWAALSRVSGRCVYAGVAEVSVYVAAAARRKGVGLALLKELIPASERDGIWMLQAGIFAENTGSLSLFERAGFRIVGTRERLGCLNGRWRDVVLMERRSTVVGA